MSHERFYTVQQVATLLQVSESTIKRLIRSRQLPVVRVGKSVRIAQSDLEKYLRSSGQEQPPDETSQ